MGTPEFIDSYLDGKGHKHKQLLNFIRDVASASFPREAVSMLTGAAGLRLTHNLKSVDKNPRTEQWMLDMDDAHVSTWLHCLTSSPDLNDALSSGEREQLAAWLDLPPSYGGCNFKSLYRSANEEFLGSFAAIAAFLIAFCRKTELPIYIDMADALESMGNEGDMSDETADNPCEVLDVVKFAVERASSALSQTSDEELALASQLIRGHSVVFFSFF
jgi:hypothetical protein